MCISDYNYEKFHSQVCVNLKSKKEELDFRRGGASLYPTCPDKIFNSFQVLHRNRQKERIRCRTWWRSSIFVEINVKSQVEIF
jgi:hypothetical protein